MAINPFTDKLLPREQAFPFLPNPPVPETFWRWRTRGVNGAKLECVRVGGQWWTTAAAVEEFVRSQTQNAMAAGVHYTQGSSEEEQVERDADTERRLQEAGLVPAGA